MEKSLVLLCPTDCLEPIINNAFDQENYFYTSLGNSLTLNVEVLKSILENQSISKIQIFLSEDNQMVLDALDKQEHNTTRGLNTFYQDINRQKESSKFWSRVSNSRFILLSDYLNKKIIELQNSFGNSLSPRLEIKGIIYFRKEKVFKEIYPELLSSEGFCAN